MGFRVSGYGHGGWFQPDLQGQADWLTGGAFGLESSIFSPLVSLDMIGLLWRWRGSVPAPAAGRASAQPPVLLRNR
jgi:hypothetical protein